MFSFFLFFLFSFIENENGTPSLYIETTAMKYRNQTKGGRKYFPNSTCSRPCESNQVMIREEQDLCCWRCRKCGLYQYKVNDQRCEDCLLGTRPTKDSKRCDSIPEEYIDYYSPWAIVAMVVASIGKYRYKKKIMRPKLVFDDII